MATTLLSKQLVGKLTYCPKGCPLKPYKSDLASMERLKPYSRYCMVMKNPLLTSLVPMQAWNEASFSQEGSAVHVVFSWIPAAASLCSFFSSPGEGGCTVMTSSMVEPTTIILAPGVTFSSLRLLSSFTNPEHSKGDL